MADREFYVYILTNVKRTVLYVGFTNGLEKRLIQRYQDRGNKATFTGRYNVHYLLYYETYALPLPGMRETELKKWNRKKKLALIAIVNPGLEFLNVKICGRWPPDSDRRNDEA